MYIPTRSHFQIHLVRILCLAFVRGTSKYVYYIKYKAVVPTAELSKGRKGRQPIDTSATHQQHADSSQPKTLTVTNQNQALERSSQADDLGEAGFAQRAHAQQGQRASTAVPEQTCQGTAGTGINR